MMCIQISTQKFRIFQNSGTKKNYSRRIAEIFPRGFHQVSEKPHQFYFDQGNSKKNCTDTEMKTRRIKRKGIEDHNTVKIIKYRQYMSMICWKPFYLLVGGIFTIIIVKSKENITPTRSIIFSMLGDFPKVHYGVFVRIQRYGKYQRFCM